MRVAGAVLAGGAGKRMGGMDKAALRVGGVPLLERVMAAARPVCAPLLVEREPGGGPVPAVQAALAGAPDADVLVVLATDLPFLRTDHLRALLDALHGHEAAAAAGPRGANPLLAAYRRPSLAARAAALGPGDAAGRLLPPDVPTLDLGPATFNVNRPVDLEAAELLVDHTDQVIATAQWLRELVAGTVPEAVESVYKGWHGFGYRHPAAGYFCAVFPRATSVHLSFERGVRLPDPRGLLVGAGRQVRHVEVGAPGDPPADHLVELIDSALDRLPRRT